MRAELPSGTVTFVFTDVEGSTRLIRQLGADSYAQVLSEHRRLVRAAFATHGGVEVDTQGDAFFYAFASAPDALEAALGAQAALAPGPIRVRIGIHTGTPLLSEDGYVGEDVHRAARVAACGHGGQVLVSAVTAQLLPTAHLRDLGEHRLKDLSAPERIYQAGEDDFPPLTTLYRTNLPIAATPFLGRAQELAEVGALLAREDVRMLTLTGPGGTGKTRLGLQAAAQAAERYPAGVFWVPLAPLSEAELVLETAAQVLGARESLAEHIADRTMLLLFDNFEHVADAAGDLPALLAACPNLQVLVTSRELLRVPGEQAYPVPPLDPQSGRELFFARARAVDPRFVESPAVSTLCEQLDNLPLALELAAARARIMSPEQLLQRLSHRLDLLKAGRGVDPRQQTLRATFEWSYGLLDQAERELFARLAVFHGGWTLEAAEQICGADLDTLQSLVDKSLVLVGEHGRFRMLTTLREYAAERLDEPGEADTLRRAHAEFFLVFAEQAETELEGRDQELWFARLADDQDNLRAALAYAHEAGEGLTMLRIAAALWRFWWTRATITEGRRWYEIALAAAPEAPATVRAKAIYGWGSLDLVHGETGEAQHRFEQALELYRGAGDEDGVVRMLYEIGSALCQQGHLDEAEQWYRDALELARVTGNLRGESVALGNLGILAVERGENENAIRLSRESLALDRQRGDQAAIAVGLANLAELEMREGRFNSAAECLAESLTMLTAIGDNVHTAHSLVGLAAFALATGNAAAAALALGAGTQVRDPHGLVLEPATQDLHTRTERAARAKLGDDAFQAAFDDGRRLTPQQALTAVLGDDV